MRFVALLLAVVCFGFSIHTDVARASIYDMDVVQRLQLAGTQAREMQKVIAASRARRNRIFKKYSIDPNAKPDMSLLQRASSELLVNLTPRARLEALQELRVEPLFSFEAW